MKVHSHSPLSNKVVQLNIEIATGISSISPINNANPLQSTKPKITDSEREIKRRNRLNTQQVNRLIEVFQQTTKPRTEVRRRLAKELGMHQRAVQIWFQNRRQKLKKEQQEYIPIESSHLLRGCAFNSNDMVQSPLNLLPYNPSEENYTLNLNLQPHSSSLHLYNRPLSSSSDENLGFFEDTNSALLVNSSGSYVEYGHTEDFKGWRATYEMIPSEKSPFDVMYDQLSSTESNAFLWSMFYPEPVGSLPLDHSILNTHARANIMNQQMDTKKSIQPVDAVESGEFHLQNSKHLQQASRDSLMFHKSHQRLSSTETLHPIEPRSSLNTPISSMAYNPFKGLTKAEKNFERVEYLRASTVKEHFEVDADKTHGNLQDMLAYL